MDIAATCTFEESHICGYQQDTTDDFDWARGSGATVTPNTGPAADHTLGSASGMSVVMLSFSKGKGEDAFSSLPINIIIYANNAIEHQKVFYGLAEKMLPVVLSLQLKTDTNNFETGRLFTIQEKMLITVVFFCKELQLYSPLQQYYLKNTRYLINNW